MLLFLLLVYNVIMNKWLTNLRYICSIVCTFACVPCVCGAHWHATPPPNTRGVCVCKRELIFFIVAFAVGMDQGEITAYAYVCVCNSWAHPTANVSSTPQDTTHARTLTRHTQSQKWLETKNKLSKNSIVRFSQNLSNKPQSFLSRLRMNKDVCVCERERARIYCLQVLKTSNNTAGTHSF